MDFWWKIQSVKCLPRSCFQDFVKWQGSSSQLDSMKWFCFDEFFQSRNSNKSLGYLQSFVMKKSKSKLPASVRFQNPDCQKKHSTLFSNFDYLFTTNTNKLQQMYLFLKFENRKLQSRVDILGSSKFICQIKRCKLLTSKPCEKNALLLLFHYR